MSTEVKDANAAAAAEADRIKNLQAEYDRKLSNVTSKFEQAQQQLLAQLQSLKQPAPAPQAEDDLGDLIYKDPTKAINKITEKVTAAVAGTVAQQQERAAKQNQAIAALMKDFPELGNGDDEFTKLAVSKFNALSDEEKSSPVAYKTAVLEAASELDIKPVGKRAPREEGDDYVGGASSGTRSSRPSKADRAFEDRVRATAQLFGVDPDKAVKRSQARKQYGKWE